MPTVQDDVRERELIGLFRLERPPNAGRSDTDAILRLGETTLEFELKSTTRGSVTTVRDFGKDHLLKWAGKHWLIGFYNRAGTTLAYCLYGSPQEMARWIEEKWEYVAPDYAIAERVPDLISLHVAERIVGTKAVYTLSDAQKLHKKQRTVSQYHDLMDLPGGYSKQRMLEIVRDRCRYLLQRGATLNNPHIPASYFSGWERITDNHAARLRELVAQTLAL